jgi:hypothetical protein
MQTQKDLINLISLKISDDKLISHFDALGLKQPKACTPNNSRGDVAHKAMSIDYYLNYEVTHEACHPPVREGKPKKWATFLTSISFVNESNIFKKPDPKAASFWNVSPPPTADLAAIKAFFDEPTSVDENTIYFCKKLNDLVEIKCQFSVKQQRARAIWASIIEQRELISYLYFRELAIGESDDYGSGMDEQNIMCLFVKWLHDNKHLNTAQNVALPADKPAILSFVKQYFSGRIWENQLTKQGNSEQNHLFNNFVSDVRILTDENGQQFTMRFKEIYIKALGKWAELGEGEVNGESHWTRQDRFLLASPVNESNYALFAKALDENLALYNRLMKLKVNREYYWLD